MTRDRAKEAWSCGGAGGSARFETGIDLLDPFCGGATACIAAHHLNRQWVGIDISPKAAELVRYRMDKELPLMLQHIVARDDIPQRTDLGDVPFYRNRNSKKRLYGEQGGICNECGEHFNLPNLTVDHIIPRSKGGGQTMLKTFNCFAVTAIPSKAIVEWNILLRNSPDSLTMKIRLSMSPLRIPTANVY
ncbi:MAG: HNH endonuclease [Roseovarius sp.]|nr:HNH endonuclease [Roseovarius sp.]